MLGDYQQLRWAVHRGLGGACHGKSKSGPAHLFRPDHFWSPNYVRHADSLSLTIPRCKQKPGERHLCRPRNFTPILRVKSTLHGVHFTLDVKIAHHSFNK